MIGTHPQQRMKAILLQGIPESEHSDNQTHAQDPLCQFSPKFSAPKVADESRRKSWSYLDKFCQRLFDATADTHNHVEQLDTVYTELLTFSVSPRDDQTVHGVSETAYAFLQRLPKRPLGLPGMLDLPAPYFDVGYQDDADVPYHQPDRGSLIWPHLRVSVTFSTNILRLVLFRCVHTQDGGNGSEEKQLVDLTADLLHECSILEERYEGNDKAVLDRWLIVRCFLWASWQRAQMLYFHRSLCLLLEKGIDPAIGSLTILRSTLVAPGLTIQHFSDQVAVDGKIPYLCSWAFNILRTDGIAIGSDFRLFHYRLKTLFGSMEGRCDQTSGQSCDGDQLGDCARSLIVVEDQSMHDEACHGRCRKLKWDEQSYRSVSGGRAVTIPSDHDREIEGYKLRYVTASDKTLAITHAWAHGQGGRPDSGLNRCLYDRYVRLALEHGCDSFFLDTVCIPERHELRREAIVHINETFRQSKLTLIIDKDLLRVDATDLTIELRESILAAILVSDWNVRAWTLLEAMKGRQNIHVLCKSSQMVSCRDLVYSLVNNGKIDMAIFALLAPHLLSAKDDLHIKDDVGISNPSLETAGMLLSYRPASRAGDDLAIWSLMINNTDAVAGDAAQFWQHQRGKMVATGFLVSSARRLKKKGLTWAPDAPYAAPRNNSMPQKSAKDPKALQNFFRAFAGDESELAQINEHGIFSDWFAYEFRTDFRACLRRTFQRSNGCCDKRPKQGPFASVKLRRAIRFFRFRKSARSSAEEEEDDNPKLKSLLNRIQFRHLTKYRYGVIAQPVSTTNSGPWSMHKHIADYSGGVTGDLVVVLGTNKSHSRSYDFRRPHLLHEWDWKGVYHWPADVELPSFKRRMLWIG